jgi:hypothetical protein
MHIVSTDMHHISCAAIFNCVGNVIHHSCKKASFRSNQRSGSTTEYVDCCVLPMWVEFCKYAISAASATHFNSWFSAYQVCLDSMHTAFNIFPVVPNFCHRTSHGNEKQNFDKYSITKNNDQVRLVMKWCDSHRFIGFVCSVQVSFSYYVCKPACNNTNIVVHESICICVLFSGA